MKKITLLLILSAFVSAQDVLVAVDAKEFKGKLLEQDKEYVFFKPDGAPFESFMNETVVTQWLFHNNTAQPSQKIPIRLIKEIRLGNGEIIDFGNDYLTAVNNNSPLIDSTMVNNNSIIAQEDASGLTLEKDGEQVFSQSGLYVTAVNNNSPLIDSTMVNNNSIIAQEDASGLTLEKDGEQVFSQSGLYVTGGITNSIVDGEDVTKDVDYLMGFKFGIERIHENGLIAGAAYTQRGFSESRDLFGIIERDSKHNTNYLSGYILKLFPVSSNIDLLVGGEVGYFLSAKSKTKTCIDNECESETETIDGKDWKEADNNMIDYGLILGSRYTINKKLYLFGTYYWGLAQLNNDDEVRHRGLQINLSYAFNGPKIYL